MIILPPLTNQKIKSSIKVGKEAFPLRDGAVQGLQLDKLINSYRWRLRYSFGRKRSYYTIGEYPSLTLTEARVRALEIRKLISDGIDPQVEKRKRKEQLLKEQNRKSLDSVAQSFFEIKRANISSEKFKKSWLGTYNNYIYPFIGKKRVDEITRQDIIKIIRQVPKIKLKKDTTSSNKSYKAKEVLIVIRAILRFGVDNDYIDNNPSLEINVNSLLPREESTKRKAVVEIERLREIYTTIEELKSKEIRFRLLFQALTALRNVGLYRLKWEYIDFNKGVIIYPPKTYKNNQDPFRLPLSDTLVDILKFYKSLEYGEFVFRNPKRLESSFSSQMSKYYKILNIQDHSPHGWRASFETLAMELSREHNKSFAVIEAQLNHKIGNQVTQAYLRSDFLDERRELMRWWERLLRGKSSESLAPTPTA